MNFRKSLITTCLFLLTLGFSNTLIAAHLIGGEITYNCQGINTINGVDYVTMNFTCKMYRDCFGGGASFDFDPNFYLFEGDGNDWDYIDEVSAFVDVDEMVEVTDDPCIEPPPSACLDIGTYEFSFTFPVSDKSYQVAYQRCCRNNTIVNMAQPEGTGVTFSVTISSLAQEICNNSPTFDKFPPGVICIDNPLVFDHGATDIEGHTIIYELCSPLAGGGLGGIPGNPGNATDCIGITPDVSNCPPPYNPIIFKLPSFKEQEPLGPTAGIAIDAASGIITGTPDIGGQFVVGVCMKEYLNGQLLSEVRRDFQFNVTACEIIVIGGIQGAEETGIPNNLKLTNCGAEPLEIINTSQDESAIEGYLWQFNVGGGNILEYTTRDVVVPFPDPGFYTGVMIVNPNSGSCSDTLFLEVDIFPEMEADFEFSYDTCVAESVEFEDFSDSQTGVILAWEWDFEPGAISNFQDPSYFYDIPGKKRVSLLARDLNGCEDTISKVFDYYPVPAVIVVEPNTFAGCAPANIQFNNLSTPIDSTYDIMWDFGDGTFGTAINEIHEYKYIDVYSVSIEITSPLGCSISRDYPFWIEVLPEPTADFEFTPDNPKGDDLVMEFFNRSEDAISWQYIFDKQVSVYQPNTTFVFDSIGAHSVELIVTHPSGCPDTIVKDFIIEPTSSFFIPNAFSPNADGKNDDFSGKGETNRIVDFEMQIYSRSGEQVFMTDSLDDAWNGRKNNIGKDLPMDIYVYKYSYRDPYDQLISDTGFVTLVR